MTGLDMEAARKVLLDSLPDDPKWAVWVDGVVERLAECVTSQDIDLRDPETENVVADAIARYHGGGYVPLSVRYPWHFQSRTWQPIEGVTLTPEEVRLLVSTLQRTDEWHAVHFAALAARLEAVR